MANISNLAINQPGLIKRGGTTTESTFLPTFQPTAIGTPSSIQSGFTTQVAPPNLPTNISQQQLHQPPVPSVTVPPQRIAGQEAGLTPEQIAAANASQVQSPPQFPGLVKTLAGTAGQPSPQFTQAQEQYQRAAGELQQLRTGAIQQATNIEGARTNLAEAGGETGLLQRLVAGKEAALTGEMQAAQQAAQTATGQQAVQQQGLAAAGGLAFPIPSQALGFFSPTTGQFTPYGGGGAGTGEALFRAGGVGGTVALGQQYTQVLQPAYKAAGAVKNDLQQLISDNPDINPFSLVQGNQLQQWVQGEMSDPKLKAFQQRLNEFLTTASPLVGALGGITNFKQSMVNSMLDAFARGSSVSQALDYMYDLMGKKLAAIAQSGGAGVSVPQITPQSNPNANATDPYAF